MKWTPAVLAVGLVAALGAGGSLAAGTPADLPDKTPQAVLAMIASHRVEGFSGHLETSVDLGLPSLPGEFGDGGVGGGPGAADARSGPGGAGGEASGTAGTEEADAGLAEVLSALSGTHEARVFADGHERVRLQVLDGAEETNVIRTEGELWLYDSAEGRAVHATLPAEGPGGHGAGSTGHRWDADALPTPERLAERLLERAGEHTAVTVEEGTGDSGRAAYTLRLDPRTDQTLVEAVTIDVDAETGMPLGVEVLAVDQDEPALRVAFTRFTPEAPDAALFAFEPPAGATVEEKDLGGGAGEGWGPWPGALVPPGTPGHRSGPDPVDRTGRPGRVVGDGWDAVVVLPAHAVPPGLAGSAVLDAVAIPVEGGRLLSTSLLTVLLADDGRVVAGPVPQQRLLDVAADTAAGG